MAVMADALTTLDNVKAIVQASGTSQDALLTLLINRASGTVRQYLGRKLTYDSYSAFLPGTDRQLLSLDEWPIHSITSLVNKGNAYVLNTDYRLDAQDAASGLIYKEDGWEPINLVSGLTQDVQAASRQIAITWVAGYYLPNDVTVSPADPHYVEGADDSLPLEISGVVDDMIAERFIKIKSKAQGIKQLSEGGRSISWETKEVSTMMGISDEQALVLNAYKRWVCA
jgi:hypothetical protein